jgi:acetolactate synthase-1/2/3 large subunit
MKASDFVAHYLEARRVTHVFELVGGMITHLLDSIYEEANITIISCHHEQSAAFAAEGYARITGIPGVALATSGPGATNLLTAVGSCFFDSTPTVFITGQVNTHELKGERSIRQLGFQETDIVSMAAPICKSAVQVQKACDLPAIIDSAFRLALEGRQGPCLVDIPMNVQSEDIDEQVADQWLQAATLHPYDVAESTQALSSNQLLKEELMALRAAIDQAKRPLLLMGGGCAAASNRISARRIIESLGIPVALSLMAVDLLPESHPQRVGFIGSYGNRWANKILGRADLLVVIGSRLDIRQTGADAQSFCEGKEIWQFDLDQAEIGVRIQPHRSFCCSINEIAECIGGLDAAKERSKLSAWCDQINALRGLYPAWREYSTEADEVNPIQLLQRLSEIILGNSNYITDVGQHQMWAAQCINFKQQDRFITSGGMGAMGFGLPAALGSAISNPDATTILVSGDGSFQLNIQELETVRRNQVNLKIVLFNNRCHGMVRQFQESYFNGRLRSTVVGYSAPDFVAISTAYGISARCLEPSSAMEESLRWLLQSKGPALLEVPLSISSKVYPKLAFGRKFGEMEPEASPVGIEST